MQNVRLKQPDSDQSSLRHSSQFTRLLKSNDSEHFDTKALAAYTKAFPGMADRAECSKKIQNFEADIVKTVVDEIFAYFPFYDRDYGKEKCIRDVTLVSVYINHSMLMDDCDWLKDSLLYWLKTILHAVGFPAEKANPKLIAKVSDKASLELVVRKSRALPANIASIYVTYTRLAQAYKSRLTIDEWLLVKEQLRATLHILTKY